jgi:hypothetical protein
MYAIKQAMLLNGALPLADITIYYMDIRTFGKGYEQFYQNAKAMGVNFVRGKVAQIREDDEKTRREARTDREGRKSSSGPTTWWCFRSGCSHRFSLRRGFGAAGRDGPLCLHPGPNAAPAQPKDPASS